MIARFTAVSRANARSEIVAQIERAIFSGKLALGDRLRSERDLADQFGVSRTTLRRAIHVLETRGLLNVRVQGAGGGVFVADPSVDHVSESITTLVRLKKMSLPEIAEARTLVEVGAAELAAARWDDNSMSRLLATVAVGRGISEAPRQQAQASIRFHVELARCAGNAVIEATVRAYAELLAGVSRELPRSRSGTPRRVHEEIVEAVRRRDGPLARELMQAHLGDFERRMRRWLTDRPGTLPKNRRRRRS